MNVVLTVLHPRSKWSAKPFFYCNKLWKLCSTSALGIPSFCLRCHHCSNASVLLIRSLDEVNDLDAKTTDRTISTCDAVTIVMCFIGCHTLPLTVGWRCNGRGWGTRRTAPHKATGKSMSLVGTGHPRAPATASLIVRWLRDYGMSWNATHWALSGRKARGPCVPKPRIAEKNWHKSQTFVVRINALQTHSYNVNLFYRKGTT